MLVGGEELGEVAGERGARSPAPPCATCCVSHPSWHQEGHSMRVDAGLPSWVQYSVFPAIASDVFSI